MNSVINNSDAVNGSLSSLSLSRCGGCEETLSNCICYIDGDEQIEDDIKHVKSQIHEIKNRHRFDFPITGYGIEPKNLKRWATIHFNVAHQEAKDIKIKEEIFKLNRLMKDNKEYKIQQRDYNNNNCDCCGKLWAICKCHCPRCSNYYKLCKNDCYVEEKDDSDDEPNWHDTQIELITERNDYKQKYEEVNKELEKSNRNARNYEILFNGLKNEKDEKIKELEERIDRTIDYEYLLIENKKLDGLREENKKLKRKIRILKISI